MCLRSGHSLGKKVHAISKDLACQYSLSSSLSSFTSGLRYLPRECSKNLISVDMQKYETARMQSFSRKESRDSSFSSLGNCKKSDYSDKGLICIMLPMFKF